MNSKIEVSRNDLELALVCGALTEESRQAGERLRTALDAPAAQPQGEPVSWQHRVSDGSQGWSRWAEGKGEKLSEHYVVEVRPLYAGNPVAAPVEILGLSTGIITTAIHCIPGFPGVNGDQVRRLAWLLNESLQPVEAPQKYDDTLLPFLALMRKELHANSHKGDRDGWLGMTSNQALSEVLHHVKKLEKAEGVPQATEYAADVANCCMMLLDVCGVLGRAQEEPRKHLGDLQGGAGSQERN